MSLKIGNQVIANPVVLAPMAGVTDWPMREVSRDCGAGLCISEMITAKTELWDSRKSSTRLPNQLDPIPRPVQIAGSEPSELALAAKRCADMGAGIIDINMGCPAKKVCNRAAGSALLADEQRVFSILDSVVKAVEIPVTLKTRLGTDPDNLCIGRVAKEAENLGIQMLSIHGRTRACRFNGHAEYDLIAEVVSELDIPVLANGDINSPEKAKSVLDHTGAAGVMIGRGAWGRPWLLGQVSEYLSLGSYQQPSLEQQQKIVLRHLKLLYQYYGEYRGVRFARKHFDWYLQQLDPERIVRKKFNQLDSALSQLELVKDFFCQISKTTSISAAA